MAFDYKKAYKEFYLPPKQPQILTIPPMNFLAIRGKGDPNADNGDYKESIGLLHTVAYTIKMSKMGEHQIAEYFDYVVPLLEGFWWQDGLYGVDYAHKETFRWISLIRLPEFVTKETFQWAIGEATEKKQADFSKLEFLTYEEGLCVQCMHIGPYDREPETVRRMEQFVKELGYAWDFGSGRYHHEIYLSDVRRCKPENLKTVIRLPIQRRNGAEEEKQDAE